MDESGAGPAHALGAILAGGMSSRFGAPKPLARLGERRIIDRAAEALRLVVPRVVLIANEPVYEAAELPMRGDLMPGLGPVGGIHAAVSWAVEEGRSGALVVGGDMPFLSPSLLDHLLAHAADADIVVPESAGRRGVEPLCAYYGAPCIDAITRASERGDLRVIGFWEELRVRRIPLAEVRRHGDPDLIFRNINTPQDLAEAERLEREAGDA